MISHRILTRLLVAALILPIALAVMFGTAHLLAAMDDRQWAGILYRVCLFGGIVWVVDLICLLVALGLRVLSDSGAAGDDPAD